MKLHCYETPLLIRQFSFHPGRHTSQMPPDCVRAETCIDRQNVLQNISRDTEGGQRRPFCLQPKQLGRDVVGQEFSQQAEGLGRAVPALTLVETRVRYRDIAEHRAIPDLTTRLAA